MVSARPSSVPTSEPPSPTSASSSTARPSSEQKTQPRRRIVFVHKSKKPDSDSSGPVRGDSKPRAAGGKTMADSKSILPQKRLADDGHTPSVSSPLNPDISSRTKRSQKESLKKRESKAPGGAERGNKKKNGIFQDHIPSPLRYKLPPPKPTDYDAPKPPIFIPHITAEQLAAAATTATGSAMTPAAVTAKAKATATPKAIADIEFYESSEHVYNRKGFRYTYCIADPRFPSSLQYRQTETEPFESRFSFEDVSSHIYFDRQGKTITTDKGFRMARANVGVREGNWYWECKILSGMSAGSNGSKPNPDLGGHVRLGWARREASLETPVGFDAYSYGLRDVSGQKVHMSRPKDFFPPGEAIYEGDVIGLEICLPSLALHRKVVDGQFNKAVDTSPFPDEVTPAVDNIIRDRVPIRYKQHLYFEQFEYHTCKELEDLMNPVPVISGTITQGISEPPNPNHQLVALRTLPFSCIKVYKNGKYMGTPFEDLLAFLPPASKPMSQPGAREGLDDGLVGYFPAISVFRYGAAEANFGPNFWYPPPHYAVPDVEMHDTDSSAASLPITLPSLSTLRPVCERYDEQIAEDIVYDIIDEVDFWEQDGGLTNNDNSAGEGAGTSILGSVNPRPDTESTIQGTVPTRGGEIKEITQEDE